MPRPRSDNPKDRQLLIRVTAIDLRVLEAAAAIRTTTPNAYARDVLIRDIEALRSDPLIARQLQIFEEFEARSTGTVTSMETSRSRRHNAADSGGNA